MSTTPLVLLHGYPFDHTLWDQVTARLNCEVIAPDLRGFGGNPIGSEEPSLEVMAEDVAHLLQQKTQSRCVIAGFSMGGYVALAFAERHAPLVAGLGLINSQALADTEQTRTARRTMIEKVRREGPRAAVEAALPKLFAQANPAKEELARFPRRAAEQAGAAGISWALEAMARRPDRSAVLERLQVPLLLVHSTEDQFIPIQQFRAVAQKFPRSVSVEIPGAGHCSPLEKPDMVAQALSQLVSSVESTEQKCP